MAEWLIQPGTRELCAGAVLAGVAWTCFCRILMMDRMTYHPVRFAVVSLLVVSAGVGLAPLVRGWEYTPGWPGIVFESSVLLLQVVSARLWRVKGGPAALRRRSDFQH